MYPGKVRLKVKRGPQDYICLYRVRDPKDGAIGWQSHKPDGFVAVAYVGDGDPFNKAGPDDLIFWLEGEKDVDTAARMGLHAFTYGSSTEIPIEAEELVRGRRIVVLGDNDKSVAIGSKRYAADSSRSPRTCASSISLNITRTRRRRPRPSATISRIG